MAFVLQTFLVTRQEGGGTYLEKKRVHMLCRRDAMMFFPPPGPDPRVRKRRSGVFQFSVFLVVVFW